MAELAREFRKSPRLPGNASGLETWPDVEGERTLDLASDLPAEVRAEIAITKTRNDTQELGTIGSYRIVSLIGRGGMGCVYLAERSDGEIEQRVAIKLLRADGHRAAWRERFLRERQLLASLQHSSIVRVIDAGHTDDERPYLVMEHIEGVAIDVFAAKLDVRSRLKLFVRVCEGVAHAHRRLIIHRDLKPSNILVDASGQPKLLDFGIAKLLDDETELTLTADRLLTPKYASPEQLAGGPQTTATDVYSLGVVLYNILTGVTPRDHATNGLPDNVPVASFHNPEVPEDIDFVLKKALRTEPEERYVSVDEFAADIRDALDGRPVAARSGDSWYRARKIVRRSAIPLVASLLVAGSLAGGLIGANRERQRAERHFAEIRQLSLKLFDIDVQVAQLPGSSKTRQLIVNTALDYLQRVTSKTRKDPAFLLEVGTAYMRVGRVLGVNINTNLGQTAQAADSEQKAEAMIDSVLAVEPHNRIALLRAAQIAHDRMILAGDQHRDADALKFARRAEERLDQYFQIATLNASSDRQEAQQVILAHTNIANRLMKEDLYDEALRVCNRGIEIARATNWPTQAGAALIVVAMNQRLRGNLDEALVAIREAVKLLEPPADEKSTGRQLAYSLALLREGQILGEAQSISLGRRQEAVDYLQRAMEIGRTLAQRDPGDFASQYRTYFAGSKIANLVRDTDPGRALELYDDGLQRLSLSTTNGGWRQNVIRSLAGSSYALARLGRVGEAKQRLKKAHELLTELKLDSQDQVELGSEVAGVLQAEADLEARSGHPDEAVNQYQQLLERVAASHPQVYIQLDAAVDQSNLYEAAEGVYRDAGKVEMASGLQARRLALWQSWKVKMPANVYVAGQLGTRRLTRGPGKRDNQMDAKHSSGALFYRRIRPGVAGAARAAGRNRSHV